MKENTLYVAKHKPNPLITVAVMFGLPEKKSLAEEMRSWFIAGKPAWIVLHCWQAALTVGVPFLSENSYYLIFVK